MGPRSAGFDEIEAGFSAASEEESHEVEFAADEEESEAEVPSQDASGEEDELAMAEQDYLREIHSGMVMSEEEESSI